MTSEVGGLFLDLWQGHILAIEDTLAHDPVRARALWPSLWRPLRAVCRVLRGLVDGVVARTWDTGDDAARPWPTSLVAFYALTGFRLADDEATEQAARVRRVPWEDRMDIWRSVGTPLHHVTEKAYDRCVRRTHGAPLAFRLVHALLQSPRSPLCIVKWFIFWGMVDAHLIGTSAVERWKALVLGIMRHMPVSVSRERHDEQIARWRLVTYLKWEPSPLMGEHMVEDTAEDPDYATEGPPYAFSTVDFRDFCGRFSHCGTRWARPVDAKPPWIETYLFPNEALYPGFGNVLVAPMPHGLLVNDQPMEILDANDWLPMLAVPIRR